MELTKRTTVLLLLIILATTFFLGIYGLQWGLPDRWNIDESIAKTLRMMANKTYYCKEDMGHPTFYKFVLALFFGFYLLVLKVVGYPLEEVRQAASISWIHMAHQWPDFATNIYLVARFLSTVTGIAGVWIIYRIGCLAFGNRIGLLSAFALSLSVGYMEVNHFAKNTSLVVLLVIMVLYFSLRPLYGYPFRKNILLAFFISGLAFATKLDGGIALLFPVTTLILYALYTHNESRFLRMRCVIFSPVSYLGMVCFLLGLFVGWPVLFLNTRVALASQGSGDLIPYLISPTNWQLLLEKTAATGMGLMKTMGPYLGLTALGAIFTIPFCYNYHRPIFTMILVGLLTYLIAGLFLFLHWKDSYTKHVILAIPLLSILSGFFIDHFLKSRSPMILKLPIVALIFIMSFIYSFNGAQVFARSDTRYESTPWILARTPPDATVEHIQDMDWLFSSKVLAQRTVIFFSRNSRTYKGSFYKTSTFPDGEIEKYINFLKINGPRGDFFVFARGKEVEENTEFFNSMLMGKYPYKLVKVFSYRSNFSLRPRPDYTAPNIFIFERVG